MESSHSSFMICFLSMTPPLGAALAFKKRCRSSGRPSAAALGNLVGVAGDQRTTVAAAAAAAAGCCGGHSGACHPRGSYPVPILPLAAPRSCRCCMEDREHESGKAVKCSNAVESGEFENGGFVEISARGSVPPRAGEPLRRGLGEHRRLRAVAHCAAAILAQRRAARAARADALRGEPGGEGGVGAVGRCWV